MLIRNYYNVEITIDGTQLADKSAQYSFALHDSIFDIYNRCQLFLPDDLGLFQELLSTVEGTPIDILFGIKEETDLNSKFVVYNNSLVDMRGTQVIGGVNKVELINDWYYKQERTTDAYKDISSAVVDDLIPNIQFKSKTIDRTTNYQVWYRALKTQAEFIEKSLLKYAYSNESGNSPFYCFINSNNEFHFRNYNSLASDKAIATLRYVPDEERNTDINVIKYAKYYSNGSKATRPYKKRTIYSYDNSGDLQEQTTSILDYYKKPTLDILMRGDKTLVTGFEDVGKLEIDRGLNDSKLATTINKMAEDMHTVKLLIICNFNPYLLSGKLLNVNLYTYSGKSQPTVFSHLSSSPWLIETCEHIWDGNKQLGYTRLIVGKKYSVVQNNYLFKDKLFKP